VILFLRGPLANASFYDADGTRKYVDDTPHIKHASLRRLYSKLVVQVFDNARKHSKSLLVLDLGAGEGSSTMLFLELGAKVVAVDISRSQLDTLKTRCALFDDMLEVRCADIGDALREIGRDGVCLRYCALFQHPEPCVPAHRIFFWCKKYVCRCCPESDMSIGPLNPQRVGTARACRQAAFR
jgi:SAM-dependent methyltransferase